MTNTLMVEAGTQLGTVLTGLVNVLNPTRIVVGGVLAQLGPLWLASVRSDVTADEPPPGS